jgi:hypothetical protein
MVTPVTLEKIREQCADPNHVSYCGMMMRPGIHAWTVEVEYTQFKPDTDANDGFHLATVRWPEDVPPPIGLYAVIIFEKRAQEFAESILWKHGLKKVREGFVQMVISPKGTTQKFPITGPNVFFLENHSKGASNVIYTNDPVKIQAAWEHEVKQTQKFFDEHQRWLATPEGKAIADAFWAKHPEGHVE